MLLTYRGYKRGQNQNDHHNPQHEDNPLDVGRYIVGLIACPQRLAAKQVIVLVRRRGRRFFLGGHCLGLRCESDAALDS